MSAPRDLAAFLGDARPVRDDLLATLAEATQKVREHEHPTWEDLYCLNLVSYMGERMAPVLRRLRDAEARVSELEAVAATVYRAEHPDSGITLGTYTTAAAAREHCESLLRRELPTVSLDWIQDDEDEGSVAELVAAIGEDERPTGYVVTPVEVASEYDEEADE
ncbi:hypothetical protein [Streptomyces fractus]|uniref:hypothetical protein n=1 Tax=Streptomyces fractus TaxID=641806 RepID=UPI003CEEC62A